ncbi:hypothetical protein [Asticcacaulis sp. AND118]|uniref:hypothetical protein n=1 Tax=Asticcacaulis sp. AND118 TaxID=2840468 RepID=UPI001CFF69D4|nr:hypothetical protein [Asticcacaulis sp. AND118]UDF03164.1 hypothetical protein LH365_12080 [Asticcacaulis sp. AND118]
MQNQISSERFEAIVDAYGADAQRWPQDERAAARLFMQQHPETARRVMAEARTLDAWLSAAEEPEPSVALQWEILAHMAPAGVVAKMAAPLSVRPRRRWMAGIGLAAACAAGIIFGVNVGLATTSEARAEAVLASASLTEVDNW